MQRRIRRTGVDYRSYREPRTENRSLLQKTRSICGISVSIEILLLLFALTLLLLGAESRESAQAR